MEFSVELAKLYKAVALDRLGGDEELLQEVAELFLEEYPPLMAQIRSAIDSGNSQELERSAHSLKGSVANFGSDLAWQAALNLESMGRAGDLDGSLEAYKHLEQIMDAIHPQLVALAS